MINFTNCSKCIKTVTVIGGGRIGSGLVQTAAQNAQRVILVEQNQELLKKSAEKIVNNLSETARELYQDDLDIKKYIQNIMKYVTGTTNVTRAAKYTDLVVEAIPEDFQRKQELFKRLDQCTDDKTIFATTTNSLPISAFAEGSTRIERFIGLHFFYPVPESKLVEIVKVSVTSRETIDAVSSWCKCIGKTAVICNDSPGFIVNRLLLAYVTEAIRIMERADATAQDIDTAMKLATGNAMGPIQLADFMGHDNLLNLVDALRTREPENRLFAPCVSQKYLVQRGMLGIKSGEGYYKYNDLKYWMTKFSHKYKNKKDWLKHYQLWKKTQDKQQHQQCNV